MSILQYITWKVEESNNVVLLTNTLQHLSGEINPVINLEIMKHGDINENFTRQDGCNRKGGKGAARKEGQLQIKRWGGERKGQVRRK